MTGQNRVTSREVMWRRVMDDLSFEQARFSRSTSGSEISGSVMIAEGGAPLRVDYRIACDGEWRTRTVEVEQTWRGARCTLRVDHDGQGRWYRNGDVAGALTGCTDIDLGVTPSTNALPVNRLRLPVGGSGEVVAAWVRFPEVDVAPSRQLYERLSEGRYRYTSLASGFTTLVEVDADGLPTDYAGVWRRVAEGPAEPWVPAAPRDEGRTWLRHCLATLAYRAGKTVRGAPPDFGGLRLAEPTAMTPAQILAHMGDLMEWALSLAQGRRTWPDSTPLPWDAGINRFFGALAALDAYLASAAPDR